MKKIILFIIGFFIFFGNVYASTSYTSTSGKTSCNNTPTSGDNDNSGHKWIPKSNNSNAASSGKFDCEKHGYWSGNWSGYKNKNTIFNCSDKEYASKMKCYNSSNTVKTCTSNGNGWTKYRIYCKKRDDIAPAAGDLTSNPSNNSYFLANTKNITITGNANGGSPIVKIKGKFEKDSDPSSYNSEKVSTSDNNTSTKDKLETTEVLHTVDNDITVNNYREFSYPIIEICDEAGNCSTNVKTFKYNVYANIIDSSSSIVGLNQLQNGNIAEADENSVTIRLRDKYTNKIIPVYKSDGTTILRKVGIGVNYNNSLYLDQYRLSGNSGVKSKGFDESSYSFTNIGNNKQKLNITDNKSYNSGDYTIKFKVYTPTENQYSKAKGNFKINSFSGYTYDGGNNVESKLELGSAIDFKFKSLYTTKFNGEQSTYGFIEGITQSGSISFEKDSSSTKNPSSNLYLEFGSGARLNSPKLNLYFQTGSNNYTKISNGQQTNIGNTSLVDSGLNQNKKISLWTQLKQTLGSIVENLENQYLSTHIAYKIDGENVVYNSDIIGKNNYWDTNNSGNTTQVGLKVLGKTYSKKEKDIINNQNKNDIHVIGNLIKSYIKRDFRSNIFKILKNIVGGDDGVITDLTGNNWTNNLSGFKMYNNKVLYYEVDGKTIVLGNNAKEEVDGRKTIVIKGGDLYIKSNMYYGSNSDILGIVVLKDSNGKGGNLYIDPDVTHIVGTIFVDKSILTAKDKNGDGEISGNEVFDMSTEQSNIANQLYIKGQIFSENSIGGSRKNPLICPYYDKNTCTLKESQKYDLNYLRRYFTYDSNNDGVIDSIANNGKYYYNGGVKSTYDNSYKYIDYSTVIEYNPIIQITPPPLFDN